MNIGFRGTYLLTGTEAASWQSVINRKISGLGVRSKEIKQGVYIYNCSREYDNIVESTLGECRMHLNGDDSKFKFEKLEPKKIIEYGFGKIKEGVQKIAKNKA